MNNRQLARKIRKQARRAKRRGDISLHEYQTCMAAANSEKSLTEINTQLRLIGMNPWESPKALASAGVGEIFRKLWDWFVENWPTILSIIMKIAPLLILADAYERKQNENS